MQKGIDQDILTHEVVDVQGMGKKLIKKNVFISESPIMSVRFDPEDTMVAAVCGDGSLKIFHLHSDKLKVSVKTGVGSLNVPATCLRWRPQTYSAQTKSVILTGGADGQLVHWHVASARITFWDYENKKGKELSRIEEKGNQINCMDYNREGDHFATAGSDNKIRYYDEGEKKVVMEVQGSEWTDPGHNNRIFSVKFLPDDPNVFISGGWDTNVHIWDVRASKSVGNLLGPKIAGDSLDYKDGVILTGSNRSRDQVQLWDYKTRSLVKTIPWSGTEENQGAFVYGCQFSKCNNESIVACSYGLNEVKVFDTSKQHQVSGAITGFRKGIYSVDYGNFTNQFAFGGEEGGLFVVSIS